MLAPFIAGKVNETLVEAHWDNLLRLAASVRAGVVSASLILQRLSAFRVRTASPWRCAKFAAFNGRC